MPYLWIWLLLTPPILAIIDLMTSPAATRFGARDGLSGRSERPPAAPY